MISSPKSEKVETFCFAEKDGTFTNTERRVQRVRKAVNPPVDARDDWEILCQIATKMGYRMQYDSTETIMDEIASVTPLYGGIIVREVFNRTPGRQCFIDFFPLSGIFEFDSIVLLLLIIFYQ